MRQREFHIEWALNGYILTRLDDGESDTLVAMNLQEAKEQVQSWFEEFEPVPIAKPCDCPQCRELRARRGA